MNTIRKSVRVGRGGRLVIPASQRRAMELSEGDTVLVELEDDELRIISRKAAVRRAQEIVARYVPENVSLVDQLIAERRREAAMEDDGR